MNADVANAMLMVPAEQLWAQILGILHSWGMAEDLAATTAEMMIETDLLGVDSHGLSDPVAFREDGEFEHDLDDAIDVLRATPAADPARPVQVAGDPEEAARVRRLRDGIPAPPALDRNIRAICERGGAAYLLS